MMKADKTSMILSSYGRGFLFATSASYGVHILYRLMDMPHPAIATELICVVLLTLYSGNHHYQDAKAEAAEQGFHDKMMEVKRHPTLTKEENELADRMIAEEAAGMYEEE